MSRSTRARPPQQVTPPTSGPLLISNEESIVDEVQRLGAAAGTAVQVRRRPADLRSAWLAASTVLVGADVVADLIDHRLPRRDRVLLITGSEPEPTSWRRAVEVGAEQVLSLPADREQLVALLDADGAAADGGVLVSVTGACGGAGASVFAAALASTAGRRERSAVLVDVDPWGGGVDLLLGGEEARGLRWPDLAATSGRLNATSLREVLPVVDDVAVLSWGRARPVPVSTGSLRTVLTAARDGHRLAVADVARREDDAVLEALALATCTLLVVPAQIRAVAAARTRLGLLREATADLRLVVRGAPAGGLDADEVATALELPLVTAMRPERHLAGWLDQGLGPIRKPRGPLAKACLATLAALPPAERGAA